MTAISTTALGKGLSSLISQNEIEQIRAKPSSVRTCPINQLIPGKFQPRQTFDETAITELAQSIKTNGVIQPVVARESNGLYEIIVGERRWRAAKEAGLKEIPIVLLTVDDQSALEMGLIENLQREDLNPLEEAQAYLTLANDFQLTQNEIADRVGKNRSTVTNAIRLLGLPESIKTLIAQRTLSAGHGRALLGLDTPQKQIDIAQLIVKRKLTVRQTESIIKRHMASSTHPPRPAETSSDAVAIHLQGYTEQLKQRYGTKVHIANHTNGKGKIIIEYYSNDHLEQLLDELLDS